MGRNGKKPSKFQEMMNFINDNVGKIVSSKEILLGQEPGRNSVTSYFYTFVKLGYVVPIDKDSLVKDKNAKFKISKKLPDGYNSVVFGDERKMAAGFIPESHRRKAY